MKRTIRHLPRRVAPFLAFCALVFTTLPGAADDTLLFTARVPPNVMLMIDNSNSMNEVMRHPLSGSQPPPGHPYGTCDILPTTPSGGGPWYIDDQSTPPRRTYYYCFPGFGCWFMVTPVAVTYQYAYPASTGFTYTPSGTDDPEHGYIERRFCGQTRKLWHDGQQTHIGASGTSGNHNPTWWLDDYLEWYYHLDPGTTYTYTDPGPPPVTYTMTGAQIIADIDSATNGRHYIGGGYFGLYQRSRMTAVREVVRDVIYKINTNGAQYAADCRPGCSLNLVRFGIGMFLASANGGFVKEPIADYTSNYNALETAIYNLDPSAGTPLGETLFKLATYFMARDPAGATTRPVGVAPGYTGSTRFPAYKYRTSDGAYSSSASDWPADPVQQACQKNFIIAITDGQPTGDQFDGSGNEVLGFADLKTALVGDYAPDVATDLDYDYGGTTPEEGNPPWLASTGAGYLDDIAKVIRDIDIRPDLTGPQHIDTYAIGLATDPPANRLLQKTALAGNGLYRTSWQTAGLSDALVTAIEDVLSKAQAFTSAAVPASRTTSAENFYTAFFVPVSGTWFWEGHLKDFDFSAAGDVLTADGHCAVGASSTANPPCPATGTLRTTATAFWDAATQMPAPATRKLYLEFGNTSIFSQPATFAIPGTPSAAVGWFGLAAGDMTSLPYSTLLAPENTTTGAASALIRNLRGCTFSGSATCTARVDGNGAPLYLGDIFHSNPVVVGSPNAPTREASYQTFASTYRTRTRVIYAGANDGFLHAFHAGTWRTLDTDGVTPLTPPRHDRGTGQELMGFMPYGVRKTVKDLLKQGTGLRTQVNVDGSPVVADVWFNRAYSGTPPSSLGAVDSSFDGAKHLIQWRTVLIQSLRDGGQHYTALDVTTPPANVTTSTTSYPRYLWSFPADDHITYPPVNPGTRGAGAAGTADEAPRMGKTWSEPVITRVKVISDDTGANPAGYERWVAIFGGGYHVEGDPNSTGYVAASLKGRAIYMVDINTGEVLAKKVFNASAAALATTEQQDIKEMRYAIASAPAVFDLDFDGFADVIYIGDLGGNLWKWVVKAPGDDPIGNTDVSDTHKNRNQPAWPFRLYFRGTASTLLADSELPAEMQSPAGTYSNAVQYQSFYFPPTGALRSGKLVLAFGSGERADPISPTPEWSDGNLRNNNHFYVLKDDDPTESNGTMPNRLTGRVVENCGGTCTGEGDLADFDATTPISCSVMNTTKKGYFITGRDAEKFVSNSTIFGGRVFTGSFRQRDPSSSDICSGAGSAYLYSFDVDCGVGEFPTAGSDQEDRRILIGSGLPTRPRISTGDGGGGGGGGGGGDCSNKVVLVTSDGGLHNDSPGDCPSSGIKVRSWRER